MDLYNELIENKEIYIKDFKKMKEKVKNSKAIYKEEPVPFLYLPKIYSKKELKEFKKITERIFDLVNTTINLYLNKKEVRDLYNFDKRLDELIRLDHGYVTNVPMGRFDLFYYGKDNYKFCELNTDGSSAMLEDKELGDILSKSKIMRKYKEKKDIKRFELLNSWVDEVDKIKDEFFEKEKQSYNLAIIDIFEKEPSYEFKEFKKHFNNRDYNCFIADARDVKYKDGYIYYGDKKIDIVYRRLVTKDLMENYNKINDFIKGIKAKKTCTIGSIKSQVVHTKLFFKVLHDKRFKKYINKEQKKFIDKAIPKTYKLNKVKKEYIDKKDKYIIKPIDSYASKGVFSGKDFSKAKWLDLLNAKVNQNYLIQQYCKPCLEKNVLIDSEDIEIKKFNKIIGLYVYNENLTGIYTRVGLNPIISGLHDCFTLPSFIKV
ncbi:MAG: hypothetical protein ACQEQE_09855 [Bacillota bacterium]